MRIAKKTGATVKYFHSDHLSSSRLVTDSSGQPAFEDDYKPFGEEASATGSEKYVFTGQYNEADIGLYYFGARWYDTSLGRFISEDPIKESMISPQSQNPYVYCMNNPLRYIDPSGMLMTEGGAYQEGYLQSYSGGDWIYYPESGGSCNVSGEDYREDHFAPPPPNTTPPVTLPDCASYGGKDPRKSYAPNCATYGGNRPPITKPGATFDDMYYPENAFNGYEVDPCLWEAGIQVNFLILSYSLYNVYNPHTGTWSGFQGGLEFGFTQVSASAYVVDTPFDSFEEYDAFYANNGHLDIDFVYNVGFKGRYYEDYGWEGGLAVGRSFGGGIKPSKVIDKILSSISISGGGSAWP